MSNQPEIRMMRAPEVAARVGLAPRYLLRLARNGGFPAGVRVGKRVKAWPSNVVEDWLKQKLQEQKDAEDQK